MKARFGSVDDLLRCYYYFKTKLEGAQSCSIDPEKIKQAIMTKNPFASRSTKEEQLAFIGDVEIFLDIKLRWWEKIIICGRIRPEGEDSRSLSGIVIDIKRHYNLYHRKLGDTYPARVQHRQHITAEARKIEKYAGRYFGGRGYLL